MSNPYVKKEVAKIISNESLEYPLNTAMASCWIIANFKGVNIKLLDSSQTSSLCDYNIIATAENHIQARTMVDEILANTLPEGTEAKSIEGVEAGDWILLDLGDVIIHIFDENSREVYDLDGLWSDLASIDIPTEYYHGSSEIEQKLETAESYF
ncbi:MAG: ribosome silencing factor [Bacteriovoracaceae bacterium]|jgi:ribosome-associated protein|nr:ribosome silencing factor [Bacteriovoracaceae bacterium]